MCEKIYLFHIEHQRKQKISEGKKRNILRETLNFMKFYIYFFHFVLMRTLVHQLIE